MNSERSRFSRRRAPCWAMKSRSQRRPGASCPAETCRPERSLTVVFLLDSDCRSDGGRNRTFSASSLLDDGFLVGEHVFFVGEVEFEDAFEDAIIATLANQHHPRDGEEPWRSEDFSSMRGGDLKLSNRLQRLFRCSKPQIGHELGQTLQDKEHVPDQIETALARAYDLANT